MRRPVATLAVLLASCGGPLPALFPPKAPADQLARPRPALKAEELPCFGCHDLEPWEAGPNFPHALGPHKKAGHCHLCHQGLAHSEEMLIDWTPCATCHGDEIPGGKRPRRPAEEKPAP